jgi:hypothetical protein
MNQSRSCCVENATGYEPLSIAERDNCKDLRQDTLAKHNRAYTLNRHFGV